MPHVFLRVRLELGVVAGEELLDILVYGSERQKWLLGVGQERSWLEPVYNACVFFKRQAKGQVQFIVVEVVLKETIATAAAGKHHGGRRIEVDGNERI